MRTIGANIRYYRCLHHLTQEKLAELADINEKSISAYENDTRIPPIFNLLEIAQALGVTMEQLCGVAGPKTIEDELLDRIRMEVKLVLTEFKIFVSTLQEELARAGVLPEDYDFEAHRELVGMQPGDVPVTYADSTALEQDYGFTPKIGISEGLRAFAEWYKEYYKG